MANTRVRAPGAYRYKARDPEGKLVTGVLETEAPEDIEAALTMQGLEVIEVRPSRSQAIRRQLQVGKGYKLEDRILFCRQLATFVRSGVPILTAMGIITQQARTQVLRRAYASVTAALQRGESLSASMSAESRVFPQLMVDLTRAAELTGRLDQVLEQLAIHYERELSAKRKIRQAMTYPLVIVALAVVVVAIMVAYVLPAFVKLFEEFSAELPLPARILLGFSGWSTRNWPWLLLGIGGGFILLMMFIRTRVGRRWLHGMVLRLPLSSGIAEASIVNRWTRTLAGMARAGVPMGVALEVVRQGMGNMVYEERLREVSDRVMAGEGMAGPLAATGLFPDMVVQMVRVGEETGALDQHLEHLANYYQDELDYRIARATSFMEPAVLLVVGLGVGFVAVSMVSTMYGLARAVR